MEIDKHEFLLALNESIEGMLIKESPPAEVWEIKDGELLHDGNRVYNNIAAYTITEDGERVFVLPWFFHPDPVYGWVVGNRVYSYCNGPAPSSLPDGQPQPYSVQIKPELFDIDERVLEVRRMFLHNNEVYIELMHGKTTEQWCGLSWHKMPV